VSAPRRIRVGLQVYTDDVAELRSLASRAEAIGVDSILLGDHVDEGFAPLPVLAALAEATETIRLGTLVLNNDLHHPVTLAQQATTLDHLSGGRFEIGLGAGHTWQEYEAMGLRFDPPAQRKERLCESIEILRPLLRGEAVTFRGSHWSVHEARVRASQQSPLPLLVAGNGSRLLAHAARHADIIGLSGFGRTLADGQRHEVRWSPERLDAQIAFIRAEAGDRWPDLELNALVQRVDITPDRRAAAEELAGRIEGLTVDDALAAPFVALGTPAQIAEQWTAARERWGITYFAVRSLEAIEPVMDLLPL
jgi:probable F420-dependent oxidoreductase